MICVFECARAGAKPSVCRICQKCSHLCQGCERLRRPAQQHAKSFPAPIAHSYTGIRR